MSIDVYKILWPLIQVSMVDFILFNIFMLQNNWSSEYGKS